MKGTLKANGLSRLVEVPTSEGLILVPCKVERSSRSRNIQLFLNDSNEVILKIPSRCTIKAAYEFLSQQGNWLQNAFESAPQKLSLAKYLEKVPNLSAGGKNYRVIIDFTDSKSAITFFPESRDLCLRYDPSSSEQDLLKVIKKFAKEVISQRVIILAESIGVSIGRVTVRDQSTLWGSCSASGTISLNWRLILLKSVLHDYIIYHELAHVSEMNHSAQFWQLLQTYHPRALENDKKIGEVQSAVMSLGR